MLRWSRRSILKPNGPQSKELKTKKRDNKTMAFISKSLQRRTVLKGLGTAMALPFLDAMLPPMRATVKPVNRFQAFYVPNGMAMEYWTPKGEGASFELSP